MSKLKKREKKLLIALGIIAVVGGIVLYRIYGPDDSEPVVISESIVEEETGTNLTRSYSRNSSGGSRGGGSRASSSSNESGGVVQVQEFERHRQVDDCWIAIKDVVYDISNLVQRYPGQIGSATEYCGTFGFDFGFLEGEDKIQFIIENSQRMGTISYQ